MANTLVTFDKVSKMYYSKKALHEISLELKEGEILGYIGPNGAGKTTTMKILVGLINQFEGNLDVGGFKLPGDRSKVHKLIGFLPQGVSFQRWRNVDNALMTFGRLSGVEDEELKKAIPKWLERFELGHAQFQKVRQLSGGMMQKVGFIQALLHKPKLLVLDEPLSGLDPQSRLQVKDIIRELRDAGTTIIFSSHILSDVQDVADRLALLNKGRLVTVGSLEDLKSTIAIANELVVEFSQVPESVAYLSEIAGNRILRKVREDQYQIVCFPDDKTDDIIHEIVLQTLAQGGKIRKVGDIVPSLDLLYMRYLGKQ